MRRCLPPALLVLLVLLAGCAPGADVGDGPREWRDLELTVPAGWVVLEDRPDLLRFANEDVRVTDPDERPSLPEDPDDNDLVAVQLTGDASTSAERWRELVADEGGTIEEDEQIQVGGLPATSIVYTWASNGLPSRERVVFVPSRSLYILLQPVPVEGQVTGPDVYLRHADEFDAVIESIEFGRPVET